MYILRALFRKTSLIEEAHDTCPVCKKELTSEDTVLVLVDADTNGEELKEKIEGENLVRHLRLDEALRVLKEGTFCSTECLKTAKNKFNQRDLVHLEVFSQL